MRLFSARPHRICNRIASCTFETAFLCQSVQRPPSISVVIAMCLSAILLTGLHQSVRQRTDGMSGEEQDA